ncbi:MAG: 3'(2'),5'-bisphosphate nucleotidase CysQ [Stagnimonas sp.]|nr:3'(2'),5'-bisphosphate nucleotidase CysQ [Stagnimonas sp.]
MESLDLINAITRLAVDAGDEILRIYQSDFAVQAKDDNSPLTEADLAAHRCILAGLAALTPDVPVISEESAIAPHAERRRWQRHWLVDPLDGTREFVKRNGEFTVNIALIENGAPIAGVVHAPALKLTYTAARGLGSFKGLRAERAAIRTRPLPARPRFLVSRSHRDPKLDAFLSRMPMHDADSIGSSLKFCRVAEGSGDLYPRLGPTSEWDTAAAQCVLEVAGGAVLKLPEFSALDYNGKDSILNPEFIAVGDLGTDWRALLG